MKEIWAKKTYETMEYQCEICGRNHTQPYDATHCERGHKQEKCRHIFKYQHHVSSRYDITGLERHCSKCDLHQVRKFEDSDLNPAKAQKIWNILERGRP